MTASISSVIQAHLTWLQLRRQPKTVEFYRYTHQKLAAFLHGSDLKLDHVTSTTADQYAVWLGQQGLSKLTMRHCVAALCALCRWAHTEGFLKRNPLQGYVKPKATPEPITGYRQEEVSALIRSCSQKSKGKRDLAMLLFLYDTGVRSSELCSLTVGDVDTIRCSAIIRHGKGDHSRVVIYSQITATSLRKYLAGVHADGDNPAAPLFPGRGSEPMTRHGVYSLIKRLASEAGLGSQRLGAHRLRHAMAEATLVAGGNIRFLQEQMGHRDLSTLQRYTRFSEESMRQMREQTSPVAKLKGIR